MAPTTRFSAAIGTSTSEQSPLSASIGTGVFAKFGTTTGRWGVRGSGAPGAPEANRRPSKVADRPLTALTSYSSSRSRNISRYAASAESRSRTRSTASIR